MTHLDYEVNDQYMSGEVTAKRGDDARLVEVAVMLNVEKIISPLTAN